MNLDSEEEGPCTWDARAAKNTIGTWKVKRSKARRRLRRCIYW